MGQFSAAFLIAASIGFDIIFVLITYLLHVKGILDLFVYVVVFVGLYVVAMTAAAIDVYRKLKGR